jgi:DtxR family transcriptional regulator, Mn-dependent transcriptional regulator
MADSMHPPVDEYLEAILELEEEGARVIQARLADRLGVSAPSVSEMVRRLRAEGYLEINGDRTLTLTNKGRDWATTIVRRHRLAERLLTDLLGLPWHRAHIEACRWEHVISAEVEQLIVDKLENPLTCPHGNPIPGAGAPELLLVPLSETNAGDAIRLERISEELEIDHDALVYLDLHGFIPGAEGIVSTVAPDQTRLVTVAGTTIAVGTALASNLYVSVHPA